MESRFVLPGYYANHATHYATAAFDVIGYAYFCRMTAAIFASIRLLMSVILHWLKGVRVVGQLHLGIRICESHHGFEAGRVIFGNQMTFPFGIELENCEPVIVFKVTNKGQSPTTLQMISLDSAELHLSERFQGLAPLPLRLQAKSGHVWFAPFNDATFLSFDAIGDSARPRNVKGLMTFADGSKKKTRNQLTPKALSEFAAEWNRELEGVS